AANAGEKAKTVAKTGARKVIKKAAKSRRGAKGKKKSKSPEQSAVELQARRELDKSLPKDAMIILAARGMVLFPRVVLPIVVGRERSVRAIQHAVNTERPIGVLLQRDGNTEDPTPPELYEVGTVASIVRYVTGPDGTHHVIAQGDERFRLLEFIRREPFLVARVERFKEPEVDTEETEVVARMLNLKAQAREALALLPHRPEDLDQAIENADNPSTLTDLVATFIDIPVSEKQEILETFELRERMDTVLEKLSRLIEVLSLSQELRERTQGKMEKAQREYYLREQLRQIQTELGEGQSLELQELGVKIDRSKMPAEVKSEARRDMQRLERMPEAAAEYGMLRSYLETLIELPWGKHTRDNLDIPHARKILDEDHWGLVKIKRRILEFLAVQKLTAKRKGGARSPILCFVGPPGVGKTSLGRSIARAMDRKFVRMSLGGVHDESEIRGHRRTYVGAMPGGIIHHLRKTGSMNPVFLLDEMDKLGRGLHGDPSSALLEALDPAQNKTFTDHYLNVPFDLSRVLFVGTANVLSDIPGPLRDRCEVIELPGYTSEEKLQIAERYLVGRQLSDNGLSEKQLVIGVDTIERIISSYTREAGVRNLEREIGAVARHSATAIVSGDAKKIVVEPNDLQAILGPERFENEVILRTSQPGVATGLAWTPVGGDVLFVEATHMAGKGQLILTGQLGDVMKESARAALSLLRTKAGDLGLTPKDFKDRDIHIHVPAGGIPKDGPSAGVAMYLALASLFTGRTVASDLAVTGEISLRGLVLPVGGIKEKVLAAHQVGLTRVLLPKRNEKDFEEIPRIAREGLEILWLENVDQAVELALRKSPAK
ncbi:MAG: ATP-dependent Lon protease, partial [Gammaproteobacteria bacterium]